MGHLGPLAMAVPGQLLGYVEAKQRFGNPNISLASLIEPSAKLCEEGIPVTRSIFKAFKPKEEYIRKNPGFK